MSEEYFYHTDRYSQSVNLFVRDFNREEQVKKQHENLLSIRRSAMQLDRSECVFYTKTPFFPEKWEQMSQKQVSRNRKVFAMRFWFWSLLNKQTIAAHCENDWIYVSRVKKNVVGSISIVGLILLIANRFIKRIDPPFYYNYFQGRATQIKHFRIGSFSMIAAYTIFKKMESVADDSFLFDTGLKYKHLVTPNDFADKLSDSRLPAARPGHSTQ